jgi:putative transposase
MVALARFFDWRSALVIVKPATFLRWHRNAFRLLWRWKSRRRGRPSLPPNLCHIIRRFGRENPSWGEERIADELLVKFGIRVSPRTVSKYLGSGRPHADRGDQRWATFVRNRAKAIVACDFFVSVSATFRVFYVFVAMEIGSRRILHINVTDHPTVEWTIQQFREFLAYDHPFRFVIHDRDSIFSRAVDQALKDCGVRALKTPVRTPTAKAYASHCTSSRHCGTNLSGRIRWESLKPCAFLGASSPGDS